VISTAWRTGPSPATISSVTFFALSVLRSSSRPPSPVLSMNSIPDRSSRRRSQSSQAVVTASRSSPTFDRSISPAAATMTVLASRDSVMVRSSSMRGRSSTPSMASRNVLAYGLTGG
jgi:hypothetical protein